MSKYAMSLATLGAASEHVRVNCIWPKRSLTTSSHHEEVAKSVFQLAVDMKCNARCFLDEEVIVPPPRTTAPLNAFVKERGGHHTFTY